MPAAKILRRLPVVAHRDTQNEQRHKIRFHRVPWAVVPVTCVPAIVGVEPVESVVKEIIGIELWGVVDRIARNRDEFRVHRQVDPDAYVGEPDTDAHLGGGGSSQA